MKKLVLFLGVTLAATIATWALKAQVKQDKEVVIHLNQSEAEALYNIVDDAAVPGQVRKPILQKIIVAYNSAFPQVPPPASHQKDSTKTKKN